MTTTRLHQLYLIGIALLVAVGVLLYWRSYERHQGAIAVILHQTDSTVTVQKRKALSDSLVAAQAVKDAEAQKGKALALVAAGKALQARTDSIAHSASEERDAAQSVLADSLATVVALRGRLEALVIATQRDSAAHQVQSAADGQTIRRLLAVIAADSTALTASQAQVRSLQALNVTLSRELGIVKAQTSTFGNVVRVVGWAGAGYLVGRVVK